MHLYSRASIRCRLAIALAALLAAGAAHADSYTYSGRLDEFGTPVTGRYDLRLAVHADAIHGSTVATPITFSGVEVVDGAFRVDFDLPPGHDHAWVELSIRPAGSTDWVALPGRTKALLAPEAIGQCWSTTGDSGSNPATNFIGTTDAQAFTVRTANAPSLRIEPSTQTFGTPALPITTNTIGGSHANTVTSGVRGATIAGGGVPTGDSDPDLGSDAPNQVTDHYGTVGGGYANQAGDAAGTTADRAWATVGGGLLNTASASRSTIGGGQSNTASGLASTVGGGSSNTASGSRSTIGGGQSNTASGQRSTVSGGFGNTASSISSTIGGGESNTASGQRSTVSGGVDNCAGGDFSWAGGNRAKVRPGSDPGDFGACDELPSYPGGFGDSGTFVWADSQNADFVSTGINQFLVRASGGVGFNTNDPQTSFDIVGDRAGHAMLVRNDEATTADGIAIRVNVATPTISNNLLSFQRNNGTNVGSVEGNGAGGVAFNTSGGDYAEYLPLADGVAKAALPPGRVVGIRGGRVALDTDGAEQLGVVSTNPAISGNDPGESKRGSHALVAFLGQVDVAVTGPVAAGDYLIASGRADGRAIAVPPDQLNPELLGEVIGRSWTASTGTEGSVRALVGLNPADAAQSAALARMSAQNAQVNAALARVSAENADLRARLARLEAWVARDAAESR